LDNKVIDDAVSFVLYLTIYTASRPRTL